MRHWKRSSLIALIVVLSLILAAGLSLAFMFRASPEVKNKIIQGRVACEVSGSGPVTVTNTGNVDAYLRVRVASHWEDDQGNIVGLPSAEVKLEPDGSLWQKDANSDTYYYKQKVKPGVAVTFVADIPVASQVKDGKTYSQVVEVFAEAIQADPETAAQGSWKVTIENGIITLVN